VVWCLYRHLLPRFLYLHEMAFSRVVLLGLLCLFARACAIQANSTACPSGDWQCPQHCECKESKFCRDDKMWSNGTEKCNIEHNCGSPNETDPNPCAECLDSLADAAAKSCVNKTNESKNSGAVCVSTAWLENRGLQLATIGTPRFSNVLCLPGGKLPCGTPGHLLRGSDGVLISYREICERRSDCVATSMSVSQLSHSFDWSVVKNDDGVQLTSVSVHPFSSSVSPSRIVAVIADKLNSLGLGHLCNFIAQFSGAHSTLLHRALTLTANK